MYMYLLDRFLLTLYSECHSSLQV